MEEAVTFRDNLVAHMQLNINASSVNAAQIGATIGVHTGPLPLGAGIIKKALLLEKKGPHNSHEL